MARNKTFLGTMVRLTRRILIALFIAVAIVAGLIGALIAIIAN